MKRSASLPFYVLITILSTHTMQAFAASKDYPITPVPFTQVHFPSGFWQPRLETNRKVTVWYDFEQCEKTGRLDNFRVAGKLKKGGFKGIYFNDSDVFKVIEGAAYSLQVQPDPKLDSFLDQLISDIAAAQEPDGYLYTARTINDPTYNYPGKEKRWSKLSHGHELYNVGHMYEGAVAHFQATGKRSFLNIAIKNADLICKTFGPNKNQLNHVPGHQEIELALVKLYRATGNEKYLNQAKFFLNMRGRKDLRKIYGAYTQDHLPVIEQEEAVGHAVRANYMYAGMTDIAALTGDKQYTQAVNKLWDNVVSKKLYITGGVGAMRHGEAYGQNYQLPNATAYNETCAAIALGLWAHRMFNLHGDGQYIDVLERSLYNGFLSGISMQGDTFFYPNPLACNGHTNFNQGTNGRAPWFGCSCCPVNIVRYIPAIPGYAYASKNDQIYINLYTQSQATIKINQQQIQLKQTTNYPWDGNIKINVNPAKPTQFALKLRIPGWAQNKPVPSNLYQYVNTFESSYTIKVNGQSIPTTINKGYITINRKWKPNDTVTLHLPMPVRLVQSHPNVKANTNRLAIERGPIVYCLEAIDNNGRVDNLIINHNTTFKIIQQPNTLGSIVALQANASQAQRDTNGKVEIVPAKLHAIPYYAWAHRKIGQMAVWLPTDPKLAYVKPHPTIASQATPSASHTWHLDNIHALNDQTLPQNSKDQDISRFTWWDKTGSTQWVQYTFNQPTTLSQSNVYWFDDTGIGHCRIPANYRILYLDGKTWKPVNTTKPYHPEINKLNHVHFTPIKTAAIRIQAALQPNFSSGILEWQIK